MADYRKTLRITLAISTAMLAGACGRQFNEDDGWTAAEDTAVCTDRQGNRVPDDNCRRTQYSGYHGPSPFLWYYLGRGSMIPAYGQRMAGGSYTPSSGVRYTPSHESAGRIARGGFGSSSHFASS
jgi:hypothetical protein